MKKLVSFIALLSFIPLIAIAKDARPNAEQCKIAKGYFVDYQKTVSALFPKDKTLDQISESDFAKLRKNAFEPKRQALDKKYNPLFETVGLDEFILSDAKDLHAGLYLFSVQLTKAVMAETKEEKSQLKEQVRNTHLKQIKEFEEMLKAECK